MKYKINITHELIMNTTELYDLSEAGYCKKDFDSIDDYHVEKFDGKLYISITGLMHLYGYKIAAKDSKCGFYDVINQRYYPYDAVMNATINECEYSYLSSVKPMSLRRKLK